MAMFRTLLKYTNQPRDLGLDENSTPEPLTSNARMSKIQKFKVVPPLAHVVLATVIQARTRIKKSPETDELESYAAELTADVSDLCVVLKIAGTADGDINGVKKTKTIKNQTEPFWNETFEFYIDARKTNILEIILVEVDGGIMADIDTLAVNAYDLDQIPLNSAITVTLSFRLVKEVDIKFFRTPDETAPSLRFSAELCMEEKLFLHKRQQKVYEALKKLLGKKGPQRLNEVPTIAILGSGGGFRAMVGLCGIFNAIHKAGILDCITYAAGLSGSAWYLATLYAQPEFSSIQISSEIKSSIEHSPFSLLRPQSIYRYLGEISKKQRTGQFVSVTDLFALMLRDTLLKKNPKVKLSDQRVHLEKATAPLPLYSAIHVKRNVQARIYHEWIEFSPYEVGIVKNGTFLKTEHFGSKFYLGRLRKQFPEFPLYYLLGIWGSAFSVLFRQLLWINETDKTYEFSKLCKSAVCENEEVWQQQLGSDTIEDDEKKEKQTMARYTFNRNVPKMGFQEHSGNRRLPYPKFLRNAANLKTKNPCQVFRTVKSHLNLNRLQRVPLDVIHYIGESKTTHQQSKEKPSRIQKILNTVMDAMYTSDAFNTISGRAASVHNPFHGLNFQPIFEEEKIVFTNQNDDETFKGLYEPLSTTDSSIYVVDGGLAFNSPYPMLLRPERRVQLYLSFDFSSRLKDQSPAFKDLIMAAEWAKRAGVPFPPIEEIIKKYQNEPVREYYVFRHPTNPNCPVIMHFVLINNKFRDFKEPGIPRVTPEDKKFAAFNIFEDAGNPFSIYNFCYSPERFDQLSALTEFNTMLGIDTIKQIIAKMINPDEVVDYEQETPAETTSFCPRMLNRFSRLVRRIFGRVLPRNRVGVQRRN